MGISPAWTRRPDPMSWQRVHLAPANHCLVYGVHLSKSAEKLAYSLADFTEVELLEIEEADPGELPIKEAREIINDLVGFSIPHEGKISTPGVSFDL